MSYRAGVFKLGGLWKIWRKRKKNLWNVYFSTEFRINKKKNLSRFILQRVSEKVGGAEGTKLDEDFMEMEKVSFLQRELFSFEKHSSEHLVVY